MDIKAIVSVNGKENVPGISVELERLSGPVTRLRAKPLNWIISALPDLNLPVKALICVPAIAAITAEK